AHSERSSAEFQPSLENPLSTNAAAGALSSTFRASLGCIVISLRHVLKPCRRIAVGVGLLDGKMTHPGIRRRPMPVPLTGLEPDRITRSYLNGALPGFLHPTDTGQDVQRLPIRMRVPGRACTGLERHSHRTYA